MTDLPKRMLEELQRRNYPSETVRSYLSAVKDFAAFKKRPDQLQDKHLREYQLHLLNDRKLAVETIAGPIAALPRYEGTRTIRSVSVWGLPASMCVSTASLDRCREVDLRCLLVRDHRGTRS